MHVVITGASGNVGTSLLEVLSADSRIRRITGIARRVRRRMPFPQVGWIPADVGTTPLEPLFEGADAVVHLAWAIQPSHDEARLWSTNVLGSHRVFDAARTAGVRRIVYVSSVGAYSPGPCEPRIDESWPVDGISTSFYSRHKATVEWMLDQFEAIHPEPVVSRLRPALIFKREAAMGIRRLFLGRFFPTSLLERGRLPLLPLPADLRFQAVASHDVARACATLLTADGGGIFNLAAEPVLDSATVASLLGTRLVHVPTPLVRWGAGVSWRMRAQPTPEGWLDMATQVPLLDASKAKSELGWEPTVDAVSALDQLFGGLVDKASMPTPALARWGSPVGRFNG